MCEPCTCPDCEAKSTLAAWLWRDVWGADPEHITEDDDAALERILDALDAQWSADCKPLDIGAQIAADIAVWVPRGASVQ